MAISEALSPLIGGSSGGGGTYYVDAAVDFKGRPAIRSRSGGWTSSLFIIGVEVSERIAYYGIVSNLITYLTVSLHQSTAAAAESINLWSGVASLLPLAGAFVADSFLGRYKTILFSSFLYLLGLALLTLSAIFPIGCSDNASSCSSSKFQLVFFYLSLYLVAIAQSGHKPCVQAFGADQFDETDPEEKKSKASFFNWWYFGMCLGTLCSVSAINLIQENVGWGLGFGLPCLSMAMSLVVFLVGTFHYRFKIAEVESPFTRIARVFVAAIRRSKWAEEEMESQIGTSSASHTSFLDRAAVPLRSDFSSPSKKDKWIVCSVAQVEEAKGVLRLIPLWVTCLMYAVTFAQSSTFFTKQGSTMERKIFPGFLVPAATLQSFISISIVVLIPIYDRVLVPVARGVTGITSGITMLQRIGTGMFLSIISMVVAAIVELKRLNVAKDAGLVDLPKATVPMSILWLVPQYLLFGLADVFAMVGLQEFFYDQMPDGLRSMGMALYLSVFGVGNLLSSFLISLVENLSSAGGESWFSNNLNRAHLDYFYWLLAGLSTCGLLAYLLFAKFYTYRIRHPKHFISVTTDTKGSNA
ncbi:protein NRT1/ PTR FAMILY 5.10-like [Nymphaea colorata]|nr:protein NRT1/ PTR FAMILY 5.10-like [Nymphaea colorata]